MVMAVFAYIYHQSFIVPQSLSIEMIMDQVDIIIPVIISKKEYNSALLITLETCSLLQIVINLTFEEQRALYTKLGQIIMDKQFGES